MMDTDYFKTSSFQEIERSAFSSIQRIFPCEDDLLDKIPIDKIVSCFKNNLKKSSHPFLIRIVGQSGSGKSTQLFPALQYALKSDVYVKINVGSFAVFHPKYELFQEKDPGQMREKTNGFALRALVLFYKYCILNRINIVLDMTLLEPEIDLYLMTLAKKMNYQIHMHVLCVPKKVSDTFIRLRQKETGRHVWISSSHYFFSALVPCLKALTSSSLFNKKDRLILWSHYLGRPLKQTHLANHDAVCVLQRYQTGNFCIKNPNNLLKTKRYWMKLFVGELYV